ncbi:MAG: hypothetical protein IPM54_24020 [Polyangiaceae bacterium]|nr:hypothetical protein [Polyangiaceae bacterium]
MKRLITFVGILLALVLPSHAIAGTPYSIQWLLVQENPRATRQRLVRRRTILRRKWDAYA